MPHTPTRGEENAASTGSSQINGSQRAILPASPGTLLGNHWQNWHQREEEGEEGWLQVPVWKLRNPPTWLLGFLYPGPTRVQDTVQSPKWRSKSHFLSAKALNLPVTPFMTNKVEENVRLYDGRISICLNHTLALLK